MRPIYDHLIERKNVIDFKMPGHKSRLPFEDIGVLDQTETYGTDNLLKPEGIIRESLDYISQVYQTKSSYYIINGSTAALQAGILSQTQPGDRILMQRNSHMSIYHALVLGSLGSDYIYPSMGDGVAGQIDLDDFARTLEESQAPLLVLTHPSYEGYSSDLGTMIDLAHGVSKLVLVDEAHGAHLPFTDRLIPSALDLGADLVVHSAHKSLPSLTQTSLLHVNSARVDVPRLQTYLAMLQSSSPSYVFMASLERAVDFMDGQGRARLDELVDWLEDFQARIGQIEGIIVPKPSYYGRDISKVHLGLVGYTGQDLGRRLFDDYSINMEYSDHNYITGIISVMNEREDLDRLAQALEDLDSRGERHTLVQGPSFLDLRPIKKMEIYEAFHQPTRPLKLDEAVGRISADFLIPYPPGIAMLAPGELVQEGHIELVKEYRNMGLGLAEEDGLEVLDV